MTQAEYHTYEARKQKRSGKNPDRDSLYIQRRTQNIPFIQNLFFSLYPQERFALEYERLLSLLDTLYASRPARLKNIDIERVLEGPWYQSENWVGMQLYVDRFCGDLRTLKEKLPYFEDLGINFLHLMPLTTRPAGPNDGGYAVNSYTDIDPALGTNTDLRSLTGAMRKKKMILMLDFVVNHTSDEHEWAKKAKAGDPAYQAFYYTYPDRTIPDAFEETLPQIFPDNAPGNFTYSEEMNRWVMTVFNSYQWDLNYKNPEVFMAMLAELTRLVNLGVDVVRFDALAFLWKQLGTISQNLPEAHTLVSLFKLCLHTVAPGVIFLAEAIVAPRDILKYFGQGVMAGNECEVAYNATLMALLWNSIATTKTNVLYSNLRALPVKPSSAAWINYIRCHDDIGLGIDDEFFYEAGWHAPTHRKFLLEYFSGTLPDSPSKGGIFMFIPESGDGRIVGTTASLAGLEKALLAKDKIRIRQAIDKIIMLHAIILSYGGIPIVYAGDELALTNDYSFRDEPDKQDDIRWMNRPIQPWDIVANLDKKKTAAQQVYTRLKEMIRIRKSEPAFADTNKLELLPAPNIHLLIFRRDALNDDHSVLVLANFSPHEQEIPRSWFQEAGLYASGSYMDLIEGKSKSLKNGLKIKAFQALWLRRI